MITRVTDNMRFSMITNNLFSVQNKYSELMEQLTTLKRINRPSDDPLGTKGVMTYRDLEASIEQYSQNIDSSTSWLNITESTLSSANDIIVEIQEMAVSQGSDTASATTRQETATALEPLIDQLLSLANTKIGDSYIFSGSRTSVKPFEATASAASVGTAAAAGDNTYTGNVTSGGSYTGAANATYVVKIVAGGDLDHATYQVSADGGRTWGAASAAGDMSAGTISLGAGMTLSFDASTFGAGDVFSVDGTVAGQYRGDGEDLSVTTGRDTTFAYSVSGESVFTDKGDGTVDIFASLTALKSALENNNSEEILAQLDNLKEAQSQVTRYQSLCGTRTNSLEVTQNNYDALSETITSLKSNLEDADVTKVMTDYQMKALALQASYSMASQIGQNTVLEFLK